MSRPIVRTYDATSRFAPVVAVAALAATAGAATVDIGWSNVTNAGNAADTNGYGSVGYNYRMSTYEVTNSQYAAFLNAVASSDPTGLFNTNMESQSLGGITRSGTSGSYTYAVKSGMGDRPVNYVGFFDAARMANWLTNGQGSGSTETGVYTFSAATNSGVITSVNRDPGNLGQVFLPTEDEWYKAAYYNASAGTYSNYATGSDLLPTASVVNADGSVANAGQGTATFNQGTNGPLSNVGAAGSATFYGLYDMNGNVQEWTDAFFNPLFNLGDNPTAARVVLGGTFNSTAGMAAGDRRFSNPTGAFVGNGIRFGSWFQPTAIPGSGLAAIGGCGLAGVARRRRR